MRKKQAYLIGLFGLILVMSVIVIVQRAPGKGCVHKVL